MTDDRSATKPLLIYLHVPFCNSKCHFCDWMQHVPVADLRLRPAAPKRVAYLEALRQQIHHLGPLLRGQAYHPSVLYWGGGTASILTLPEIEAVSQALREEFDLSNLAEATIESSPESLTPDKLSAFLEAGFDRISIGIQSFDDERLRRIGRAHSAAQAIESVWMARDAGFSNLNIDLIVGFPDERLEDVERSMAAALELPVNHYSIYPFRPAGDTVMRRQLERGSVGKLVLEEQLAAYDLAEKMLVERGFEPYSMSYFGHPQCLSDMVYFRLLMDWVGLGAGVHSILDRRYLETYRSLSDYIERPTTFDWGAPISTPQIISRLFYFALMTFAGADHSFEERTGVTLTDLVAMPEVGARGLGQLILDRNGVRLRKEDIYRSFIEHRWLSAPTTSRERTSVGSANLSPAKSGEYPAVPGEGAPLQPPPASGWRT